MEEGEAGLVMGMGEGSGMAVGWEGAGVEMGGMGERAQGCVGCWTAGFEFVSVVRLFFCMV